MIEKRKGIWQLSLGLSRRAGRLVPAENADEEARKADYTAMQISLHSSSPVWPHGFDVKACPHPILLSQSQLSKIENVHQLLSSAITNIVERWWSDAAARFPERMPIERHEEEVLQWMDSLDNDVVPPFNTCQGSWRPDFLLEDVHSDEGIRICEINSRFALNGFFHTAFCQQAYIEMDDRTNCLTTPAARPKDIVDGLLTLFDTTLPLHLLKGEESGLDIHQLVEYVHTTTGQKPSLITPSDLRLVPSSQSVTGFSLCCLAGQQSDGAEVLEPIHQVGLELCQHELRSLSSAMLREISLRCFNDLRTIFLVHDKRMLGIVLQELDSLVKQHRLFSPAQAGILRRSITPTINPGSYGMEAMFRFSQKSPHIRKDFLLKPIRGGKGVGIMFGSDMTAAEWTLQLKHLQHADLDPERAQYVVQLRIEQPRFDLLLNGTSEMQHNYLVGTYMSIHGQYLGLGFWRSSPHRISALSRGGDWICTVAAMEEQADRH